MQRTNEIKSIMRQLRDSNEKNESLIKMNEEEEELSTENDASESDLVLARLEDILSRFEKVIAMADGDEEEEAAEDEKTAEDEEAAEDEDNNEEEEEAAEDEGDEEAAEESLERRVANLERRFTEARRRQLRSRFTR